MTTGETPKTRHHGNLKKALVDAGIELLAVGGHAALTLRRCAARAGVSHAAPAHHFNGLKGLLTAIAAQGFRTFAQSMIEQRDGAADDPHARLVAVGNGYLSFASGHEALAALMFMTDKVFTDDPDFGAASAAAYQVLADVCAPFSVGGTDAKGTEVLVWSLVEGYAGLARAGMIDTEETPYADILRRLDLKVR